MSKKNFLDKSTEAYKIQLGELIKKCRRKLSLRKVTDNTILSASNLQYIERGINAPTAEAYEMIIKKLNPDQKTRADMDKCYMAIRKAPPPDVCKTVMNTDGLIDALRNFNGQALTDTQAQKLQLLLASFSGENQKGENNHD